MKASLKVVALSFVIVMGMGLGSFSRAQELTEEKHPPVGAETPKAGVKEIPEDLNADLNVSFYSKYVWRGLELSKDSLVIFPTMTIGYKGFAVNLWADLDTRFHNPPAGGDKEFKLQETDVTLSYNNAIKPLNLNYSLGWIYYDTDGLHGDTPSKNQELYITLGLDTILKPTFCVYDEIELGEAWYFLLGVSHSVAVYKEVSLDLAATVAYYHNKSTEDFSNFHDGNVAVDLKIPLNKYLSVMPKIQYSFPLNSHARHRLQANSFDGGDSDFVYGGIIFDLAI